jgi:hypothetical protein
LRPIGERRALTVVDVAVAPHRDAGHEAVHGGKVLQQVRDPLDCAELIAHADVVGQDARER